MENQNSVAFIAKINKISSIEGADKIQLAQIEGWTSIVQKDVHKEVDLIEQTMNSASQYSKESTVTRTELANVLISAGDTVFETKFEKQDGTDRILVGRLVDTENTMGRSNAVDLKIATGHNQRQIDHRTLEYVILKNTKYTVKKK